MHNFESKVKHDSQSHPGVAFTVRRLNQIQRAKRDLALLEPRTKYSELQEKFEAIGPPPAEGVDPNKIRRLAVQSEMDLIVDLHIKPAYIKAGLVEVTGETIDGQVISASNLVESGPEDLIEEVYVACFQSSGLSVVEQKNSQSPTISGSPEDGRKNDTTATTAETLVTIGT